MRNAKKKLTRTIGFLGLIGIFCFLYSSKNYLDLEQRPKLEDYIEREELVLSKHQVSCSNVDDVASISGKTQWSSDEQIEFELINHSSKELYWWPYYDSQETGLSIRLDETWFVVPFNECDIGLSLYEFPGNDIISSLFKFGYPELCPGLYRFTILITDTDNNLQDGIPLSVEFEIKEENY